MIRKKALALTSLLLVLLASFASIPPASSQGPENHSYIVMGGILDASTQLGPFPATFWDTPFQTRPPDLTPNTSGQNITFSQPWQLNPGEWMVNLTVPVDSYSSVSHVWYDKTSEKWYKLNHYLPSESEGYGWIFLNATGDVDYYTWNNDTGVYWGPESDMTDQLAALTGDLPDPGTDGVAGTSDDGFGDNTLDPAGSSIIMLPTRVRTDWWNASGSSWDLLFDVDWPIVFTTGTAHDIVDESQSDLNGDYATVTGWPWEFYAGRRGSGPVPHGHPKWNAYVKYVSTWSMLNIWTEDWGYLDALYKIEEVCVREDCVIADADSNQLVNILDILAAAVSFGASDEGPGPDGTPETDDDKPDADPNFDARPDMDGNGLINILDILAMAVDFGYQITPQCLVRP